MSPRIWFLQCCGWLVLICYVSFFKRVSRWSSKMGSWGVSKGRRLKAVLLNQCPWSPPHVCLYPLLYVTCVPFPRICNQFGLCQELIFCIYYTCTSRLWLFFFHWQDSPLVRWQPVYLIKYLPLGHLSELCTGKILSPSRFRHLLCVLYVFVPYVIDFVCTESTSPSQDGILTCSHLWGIQTQMLFGLCMENFCWLPINSHLLLISIFFDDACWFKYALCTSQLVFALLFYEIKSPGWISCQEFFSCLR